MLTGEGVGSNLDLLFVTSDRNELELGKVASQTRGSFKDVKNLLGQSKIMR
jgi:hypothetical protein